MLRDEKAYWNLLDATSAHVKGILPLKTVGIIKKGLTWAKEIMLFVMLYYLNYHNNQSFKDFLLLRLEIFRNERLIAECPKDQAYDSCQTSVNVKGI